MLRSATSRSLVCALADGLVVCFGPIALAAILGADVAFTWQHDPGQFWGFLVPLGVLAGVWGFFDARARLSGNPRVLRAGLGGGVAASGAFLFSQVFGVVQTAYAVGPGFPVIGEAAAGEWTQYGFGVAIITGLAGVIGALCGVGLSRMNAALLRVLPS